MDTGRISRVSDPPIQKRLIPKFSGTRKSHNSILSYTNIGVLICVYIICAGDLCHSVVGQEATLTSNTSDHFNKSTACVCGVDRVPCAKSLISSDCPNGRVISRRDCPCCFVCAKQLTDECNNEELLCDADYGLECGSDKHCKAKTQCSDDTSCLNDQMCVGGACADACKVLPDVCKETNMTNGICVARNHRALCTCSPGTTLNSEKMCSAAEAEVNEGKKCEIENRQINSGETTFTHKCQKSCKCEASGELSCQDSPTTPVCQKDFIPMSNITGEMSDACKILIGNDALFDGCCVPQQCQVIKPQDHAHHSTVSDDVKGGRDFKLTESHNNLGEDDKSKLKIESTKDGGDGSSSSSSSAAFLNNELLKTETKEADGRGSMQVTVLKRSDHSAVIKLPKNDKETILSIALSNELAQRPGSDGVWKEHRIPPGLPQITLSTLLSNTSYTLKYAVDAKEYPSVQFITDATPRDQSSSMENDSHGSSESSVETEMDAVHPTSSSSTEQDVEAAPTIIPVGVTEVETTVHPVSSVGCLYNGTSYELGEIFHIGCDERCECLKNGEVKCMERCSIPLFKKGAFSHDKMCFEEPSGVDDCCVLIACARAHPHGRTEESGREIVAIIPQPCDSVKCGPNAHCLGPATGLLSDEEQQTNQTLCVCNEGQIGDPYDEVHGCQSGVTPTSATEVSSSSTSTSLPTTPTSTSTQKVDGCVFKNKTYTYGEEHFDDCSYKCRCETSGEFLCVPRCNYRRDEEKEIPLGCEIKKDPSDLECCEMLVCQGEPLESGSRKDSPTVPTDGCLYKNTTYAKDEKFYDGCIQQCMCFSNGDVTCQPRCPPAATNSSGGDDCVTLPDPSDKCCMVTVCGNSTLSDVMKDATTTAATLMDYSTTIVPAQGEGRSSVSEAPTVKPSYSLRISLIHPLNESTIMVAVRISDAELSTLADESITIQYITDTKLWKNVTSKVKDAIKTARSEITLPVSHLDRNTEYHFKAIIGNVESNIAAGFTKFDDSLGSLEDGEFLSSEFGESQEEMDATTEDDPASITPGEKLPCMHKDKSYAFGEEFFDTCEAYCTCQRGGKMKCVEIDCPVDGLDLLDDSCVKWEPDPKFKKEPPNCCSQMRCVQHSSCIVEGGIVIRNFDEIPQKITGCDKRCYCEFGNVTCQSLCPVMTEHPPANLPCPKQFAAVMTMPENECCYQWSCRMPQIPQHHLHNLSELSGHQFPFGLNPFQQGPPPHGMHRDRTKVANIVIHPLNESTLQIDFTVSPILVGLQGHVEVLYTSEFEHKSNPAQWERKIFQQAEDLIDNTHLQLFLTNLKPDTEYHVQIKVVVIQSDIGSTSDIMIARTPPIPIPTTTLPPEIIVDPEVQLRSTSSNSITLHWRKFTDFEKNLVDGVQIAYKASDDKVYSTTPLIHRSLSEFELENLQPDKEYEVKILFIPFDSNQTTALKSEKPIFVRTTKTEDEYSFNIAISHAKITETSVEINIDGVPHPEDKFVNIYQVIYMSDQKQEQKDYFKVPKRETSKKATLTDLKPATNYTLWLEAFLSNGKKKRSNVISIQTKAGQLPRPEEQENHPDNLQTSDQVNQATSYYGALVALAVVAALSIIGVIALLMIIKKQNYAKAPINDRKSESSYDNPSFKSYDVESNGHMKPSEL